MAPAIAPQISTTLTFRLSLQQRAALGFLAATRGTSESGLLREWIREGIRQGLDESSDGDHPR